MKVYINSSKKSLFDEVTKVWARTTGPRDQGLGDTRPWVGERAGCLKTGLSCQARGIVGSKK